LGDLERAINDRHRLTFKGKEGALLKADVLASGKRPPLAERTVSTQRTVQAFTVTLGMVIKKAAAEGLVSNALWPGVATTKVRQPVLSEVRQVPSPQEVSQLAEVIAHLGPSIAITGRHRGDRLRAAILLAGTSGPRPGELTGLRTADVFLDDVQPHLVLRQTLRWYTKADLDRLRADTVAVGGGWVSRPLKHPATGVTRKVPIHPLALPAMRDHLERYAGTDLFFSGVLGNRPLDWGNVEASYWRPACQAVFTEGRSFLATAPPKTLRKAALTAMLAEGINPYVVAAIAGHDPATLMASYAGVIDQRDGLGVWCRAF
jgi:integrase